MRECNVEGCQKDAATRGMCPMHYQRWRKRGDVGSAEPEIRSWNLGPTPCTVDGCEKTATARGLCPMHKMRQTHWGHVGGAEPVRVSHKGAVCAVEGCGQQRRKVDWCAVHYAMVQRFGEIRPSARRWNERADQCIVCDRPAVAYGKRKFCGDACYAYLRRHNGQVLANPACRLCGEEIVLAVPGKRRRNSTILCCRRCSQDRRKHGLSVGALALRDGTDCGICRASIDMGLKAPDLMRPSIDHKWPRALGGTNDPENLQLAHLLCNVRKGHRVDEEVTSHAV